MNIRDVFAKVKVIPVLTVEDIETTLDLVGALMAGGLSVFEVTLRTPTALAAVDALRREYPEIVTGVGTVTRPEEFPLALQAGAQFAVSPGFLPELGRAAHDANMPYMPAAQTGSEVMVARAAGFTALKFFPAKPAGGVQALKSFAPVFPDVVFCPTGGLGPDDVHDYLSLGNVIAVGGGWMVPADAVKRRDWRSIETLARQITAGLA